MLHTFKRKTDRVSISAEDMLSTMFVRNAAKSTLENRLLKILKRKTKENEGTEEEMAYNEVQCIFGTATAKPRKE